MNTSKKIYNTPELEFLANETMLMVNTWNVDKVDDGSDWEKNNRNHPKSADFYMS